MLGENIQGQAPSQGDLTEWADTHGLTHPVVSDASWLVTSRFIDGSSFALPSMHLMAAGMEILRRDTIIEESDIRQGLP